MVPIGTIAKNTATGDMITGPGYPTYIVNGLPVCCVGDAVAGPACTGAVTVAVHPTFIIGGRPVGAVTENVVGVNPATGVPVTTAVVGPGMPTYLV